MQIEIKVINTSTEERDFVNKDGTKRHAKIAHVLGEMPCPVTKRPVIVNLRSYNAEWSLPKIGEKWPTPMIRRLESSDGNIYEGVC
jgi:hypothetical protein